MASELKKRKISSEAYQLMVKGGIFTEEDKIELLDGEIIDMSPVNNPHIGTVLWLSQFFIRNSSEEPMVLVQSPIRLSDFSEPEPDISICKYADHFYRDRKVTPKDVLILIEVSDSTLAKDREIKLPLYAEAGIETYWIVNLADRQLEVYTDPEARGYKSKRIYVENDRLKLPQVKVELSIQELLG